MTQSGSVLSRRAFLGAAGALVAPPFLRSSHAQPPVIVNDIHSQLNETRVRRVLSPRTAVDVQAAVRSAAREGIAVSLCGSRHAMGGQQFGADTLLIDLRSMNGVRAFDADKGTVTVDAGIEWPALVAQLLDRQRGRSKQWGIAQKQTGADRLTIAGALSANAHGRGLKMAPFVGDVESFQLVDGRGELRRCSRTENTELFRLAIGGYGLFGVITTVTLRLAPRRKVERLVEVRSVEGLMDAFDRRIAEGYTYGDFQYAIDAKSDAFMRRGVFSCYRPVADSTPIAEGQKELSEADWRALLQLAHADGSAAFDRYAAYYLTTSGQVYWSDLHQLSTYLDGYHRTLDTALGTGPATEMITEIYVPRAALGDLFEDVRRTFRTNRVPIVYGTVRLIERAAEAFRALIDMAVSRGGSYFLTYHRWARREQVEAAYPRFVDFLRRKLEYDPQERFQSEWWRHYRAMFADRLKA